MVVYVVRASRETNVARPPVFLVRVFHVISSCLVFVYHCYVSIVLLIMFRLFVVLLFRFMYNVLLCLGLFVLVRFHVLVFVLCVATSSVVEAPRLVRGKGLGLRSDSIV